MSNRLYGRRENFLKNENYENDIHYVFQLSQLFLKPIGVWPLICSHPTKSEQIVSMVLMTVCFTILLFLVVPFICHTLFEEKDLNAKIKLFGPVGYYFSSTLKYCYLSIKSSAIKICIEHVQTDWKSLDDKAHRAIMTRNVTVGRNLTVLCAFFLYIGGVSYDTLMPIVSMSNSVENITYRYLAHPVYNAWFDAQSSPTYEIVFGLHCLAALITYNITTAECNLAAIFVTHICGSIQVQMARLNVLIEENKKMGTCFEDGLAYIVRDHVETLRYSRYVEDVLAPLCLMEIISSTLIICLLEYYCIMEWEKNDAVAISTYVMLLCSFIFNMLIFCYIGELLVAQSRQIGMASYDIAWYNLPERKARDLILLIIVSNYPPKLTAGKMVDLSLQTFGAVLKTSIAYLNILRTVTE